MADREFETIDFEVPSDASYGDYEITDAGYNVELDRIFVVYEGDDLPEGWDQLIFGAERDGDEFVVQSLPAGLMSPEDARDNDSPGAVESRKIHDLLRENGVRFE